LFLPRAMQQVWALHLPTVEVGRLHMLHN
jgi:hypothetical protein